MATVIVREYADIKVLWAGRAVMAPSEPSITTQSPITTSGTSAPSAAFNTNTQFIAVATPAASAVAYEVSATPGATTVATTSSLRLAANSLFYIGVRAGDKISFIDVT